MNSQATTIEATPLKDVGSRNDDRTEYARRRHLEQLSFFANHDSLTGLPNRRLLFDRFDQLLARHQRCGEGFTVAFVDLNRFRQINDQLGHLVGDELLRHVANCLRSSIRACDTGTPQRTLARALRLLDEPLTISGQVLKATCSIGVALCPRDGTDTGALLGGADDAMYRAKGLGHTQSRVHGL